MASLYGSVIERTSSGGARGLENLWLPNGACSYRDLTGGARAPTCGCRRFWLNQRPAHGKDSEIVWCFCGHHACFHEMLDTPSSAVQTPFVPITHSSRNGGVDAAKLQSSVAASIPNGDVSMLYAASVHTVTQQDTTQIPPLGPNANGLGIRPHSPGPSIDIRLWHALNGFAREQDGDQSVGTSALPSTAVPSVIDEPSASLSQVLYERLRSQQRQRSMAPPVSIPQTHDDEPRLEEYSATEVATPSVAGTPDFRAVVTQPFPGSSPGERLLSGLAPSDAIGPRLADELKTVDHVSATPTTITAAAGAMPPYLLQEIYNTLQDQSRRIEDLESLSFSHTRSDNVYESLELLDGRVLDLEHWRAEQDKAQAANDESDDSSSSRKRSILAIETNSFMSDLSDTNAAAQTEAVVLATLAANAETHPRIDALELRIEELEHCALPSLNRPWHVQLVLLPFGRQLPGIWFSSSESTRQSQRSASEASEEWHGAQLEPRSSFHSVTSGAWTTESIEAWASETQNEWLSPKACGPTSTAFQRLESRGFVRNIHLTAPDASHILAEVFRAFERLPCHHDITPNLAHSQYRGLREKLIPLRKIRKSSRLRFLSPAEMVTSTSWTAPFLDSSVFMKVNEGQRRMYVTLPQAYVQSAGAGWSWQALKSLPLCDGDGDLQAAQAAGKVIERCWTYNDRFDRTTNFNEFLTSQDIWSTRSQSANEGGVILSALESRSAHSRSESLPSSVIAMEDGADARQKRRDTSLEARATGAGYSSSQFPWKRRRMSESPEFTRSGVNFTPRWSHEPPTPHTFAPTEDSMTGRSQAHIIGKRALTPQAYATPHSNSYTHSNGGLDTTGGDTEVDMDESLAHSDHGDESDWEGVQDGTEAQSIGKSFEASSVYQALSTSSGL